MKIVCIGNCQMETLAWYIKYLLPNDECWWISFNTKGYGGCDFNTKFNNVNGEIFTKDFIDNVRCPHDEIDYIKSCDYVIYIKINKTSSPNYHPEILKTYLNDNQQSLSVTNYYIKTDKYTQSLAGTISRDQLRGVDIGINKIINQKNKKKMLPLRKSQPNHPPSNYFLKLLELICENFDWQYFSKEDHEMFLRVGFPHGTNLK